MTLGGGGGRRSHSVSALVLVFVLFWFFFCIFGRNYDCFASKFCSFPAAHISVIQLSKNLSNSYPWARGWSLNRVDFIDPFEKTMMCRRKTQMTVPKREQAMNFSFASGYLVHRQVCVCHVLKFVASNTGPFHLLSPKRSSRKWSHYLTRYSRKTTLLQQPTNTRAMGTAGCIVTLFAYLKTHKTLVFITTKFGHLLPTYSIENIHQWELV